MYESIVPIAAESSTIRKIEVVDKLVLSMCQEETVNSFMGPLFSGNN